MSYHNNPILPWDEDLPRYPCEDDVPFRSLEQLGRGGTAAVDKVIDMRKRDNRVYVRKSFVPNHNTSLTVYDLIQVKLELKAILKLQHNPHIVKAVTAYEVGPGNFEDDPNSLALGLEKLVLIMEPVASHGDLDHFMKAYRDPPNDVNHDVLDEPTLLRSFSTLPSAVAYIHSKGMMHRDIKPNNCLVHKGNVLLTDFGLAHVYRRGAFRSSGDPGDFTPRYAAPEVRGTRGVSSERDGRSDVFSLGCVFVEVAATLLGDRCKVNPWFHIRTDQHGNRLENIKVSGHNNAIGLYGEGCEAISNGLHTDPTSNYYTELWIRLMNETLPSMLRRNKNKRATIQEVLDNTRHKFELLR
ncbi:kinase-like domain-containing protein [Xylaria arbuscula]|nr:kinase-like domain-containing protein [Xylaria arbuscula]